MDLNCTIGIGLYFIDSGARFRFRLSTLVILGLIVLPTFLVFSVLHFCFEHLSHTDKVRLVNELVFGPKYAGQCFDPHVYGQC